MLQQLAVIGRQFPLSLIRQVIAQPEAELYGLLASLQHKEFLYEQPVFPESEYIFKHALTQDVAYGTLLQEQKKQLHERTGQALEQLYKENLDEHYSELAHHYQRSGNTEKTIEYLQKAGQQAVQRSAYAEAISPFTTALELLNLLPHTTERLRQELELQIILGAALTSTVGWGAPQVQDAYARARVLCQQLGEASQIFSVLNGLRLIHHTKAEFHIAQQLAEQLLELVPRLQDPVYFVLAYQALAAALWGLGEFTLARTHCEQGLSFYEPEQHSSHTLLYGDDAGLLCACFLSSILWILGYPDQARQKLSELQLWAQELSDPLSLTIFRAFASFLFQYRREWLSTGDHVKVMRLLAAENGFLPWVAVADILQGWVIGQQGRIEEGIEQIGQGLTSWQTMGSEGNRPYHLLLLAEVYKKGKQPDVALDVLNEALMLVDKTGERIHEAELYRLKGELLLMQARQQENQKAKGKRQRAKGKTNP